MVVTGWGSDEESALKRLLRTGLEIAVVENSGEQWDEIPESLAAVKHVRTQNGGYGRAGNDGASLLESDVMIFTQADTFWTRDHAEHALSAMRAVEVLEPGLLPPIVGPCGGTIPNQYLPWSLVETASNGGGRQVGEAPKLADWICGCWMMIDRRTYVEAGGWPECYRLYYEDVDLSLRAACAGARSILMQMEGFEHKRGATIIPMLGPERKAINAESLVTFESIWRGPCVC